MKILYGVAGEGMGHATRSSVVIDHLRARGHQVKIVSSGRAFSFLQQRHPDVQEIVGLRIHYVDGAVDPKGTIQLNAQAMPAMMMQNLRAHLDVANFAPEVAITDFEPFASVFARSANIPVLSIDNLQVFTRCLHAPEIVQNDADAMRVVSALSAFVAPNCDHYIVTSFFGPTVHPSFASNTTIVPPILRDGVLRSKPTYGQHVLVYQTSVGDSRLLDVLHSFPSQTFIVYGLRRNAVSGNCILKDFSEQEFLDDLAGARAVVANGGMSLLGEAVVLCKPIYCVPVRGQFEQVMNARYISQLGFGLMSQEFDRNVLATFLANTDHFARNLFAKSRHDGNRALRDTVDKVLDGFSRAHQMRSSVAF